MIKSLPRLLHNLHTMSLAKAAPEALKDHECKKNSICPQEKLCSGKGFCLQGPESQDPDQQRYGTLSFYLALQDRWSFSHSHGICFRSNWEKGLLQDPQRFRQSLRGATWIGKAGKDDNLRKGLLFFLALTRRAIEAMMMKLIIVVAMECFADFSASSQWSSYHLILTPP